jgi:hypothetical protein
MPRGLTHAVTRRNTSLRGLKPLQSTINLIDSEVTKRNTSLRGLKLDFIFSFYNFTKGYKAKHLNMRTHHFNKRDDFLLKQKLWRQRYMKKKSRTERMLDLIALLMRDPGIV